MLKVFISQPMSDKTADYICRRRNEVIDMIQNRYGEIEIIDSYFDSYTIDNTERFKNKPLAYLSMSIALLATADIAVFVDDWDQYRGCKIEYQCAIGYGIKTVVIK